MYVHMLVEPYIFDAAITCQPCPVTIGVSKYLDKLRHCILYFISFDSSTAKLLILFIVLNLINKQCGNGIISV